LRLAEAHPCKKEYHFRNSRHFAIPLFRRSPESVDSPASIMDGQTAQAYHPVTENPCG
jgi:hypothetical protein